jgi:Putative transposase, YhgA-like.
MQSRIQDWVELIVPDCKKEWIKEMDAEKVPSKKESRLDKLIFIDAPDKKFILNIEPQGYLDYKLPARMLRYRSDIWEYTIEAGIGTPSIRQIVIYFYSNHDNKQYSLDDAYGNNKTLEFKFESIKVWKMKKENVINRKLIGLYPLIPLMEKEFEGNEEKMIEIAVQTINTVHDEAIHADLLSVMSILAGEKFSTDIIKKYVRREMLMNSPIYNEWVEEERREAAEKAAEKTALQTTRKNIIELLSEKFDFVSKSIREDIEKINDINTLNELFKKAVKIASIEDFQKLLVRAIEAANQ